MASSLQSETIDLSTLVTALETLITLAKRQKQQEIELKELQSSENESKRVGRDKLPHIDGAKNEVQLELEKEREETENHVRRKLIEIHSRLKNGSVPWDEDEDMVEEGQSPSGKMSLRQRAESLAMAANPVPPPPVRVVEVNLDDTEDEGAVTDPSPSPQVPQGAARIPTSVRKSSIVPGKESVKAIVNQCVTVFDTKHEFQNESKALSAQLLAELAKTDVGRSVCLYHQVPTESGSTTVVRSVSPVLGPECPLETTVQVCRILANLCYECKEGRRQILEDEETLKKLVEIAKSREYRAKSGEDPGQRLPAILPGFLLNFCNQTPEAIHATGKLGFLNVVADTILSTKTNDAVFNNCLLFLNCLVEEKESHTYLAECQRLNKALSHIMQHTTSPEVAESTLEFIQGMTISESLIFSLAKGNLCKQICDHVEGPWKMRSEFEDHRKTACNLLILILSDTETIDRIFSEEETGYSQKFMEWIKGDDEELVICGCLCLGNFACKESNIQKLVDLGASEAIVKALSHFLQDPKISLASLGAIKNMMVPKVCRKKILDQGLIDPCMYLILNLEGSTADHAALMKAIVILRFAIDGNKDAVASMISYNGKEGLSVIAKLVYLTSSNPPPPIHVQSEATRLIASILKNCHSSEVIMNVITCGGIPPVVFMLHSRHMVMLNEALLALSLMTTCLVGTVKEDDDPEDPDTPANHVSRQLHTDAVINAVKACLTNKAWPNEMKINACTLMETLLKVKTNEFKKMLEDMNFIRDCLDEEALGELPQECSKLKVMLTN